jgi:plasmid replication initiation protein
MVNNFSVTKSNSLIDASYKLNVQAQKLVLACISKIDPRVNAAVPKEVVMTALEYGELMGIKHNARRDLYKAADALFKSSITIFEGDEEIEIHWIQKKAKKIKGESAVILSWSDDVLKYITQLKTRFTSYKLRNISKLESIHSIRLYELLMKFNATGERVIFLDDFKSALGISDKYPLYKDLNKWVIKPAVSELNQRSDLDITFTAIKKGRAVGALGFEFKKKDQMQFDAKGF